MINFWDFSVWGSFMLFAVLLGSLLVANILKKSIPFLEKSLIPTSVLGGGILLIIAFVYKLITGDVMFYGKGAGKLPTASAVMADIIDCVKHIKGRKFLKWEEGSNEYVADYLEDTVSLYVRAKTADNAEAEEAINGAFNKVKFVTFDGAPAHEIAFITPEGVEKDLRASIKSLSSIIEPINVLRVCE